MSRNGALDSVKFLMILLVVFGHFIEPIIYQSDLIKIIYMSIYSVHMPVFIILSGMLTKLDLSATRIRKNIISIIVPFIVFTILYELFNVLLTQQISAYTLKLQPYWILWFLLSLFIWKTLLPVVMQFRYPFLLSIVVSLGAGLINDIDYFLGISRTLYFFPFFILGFKLGRSGLSNEYLNRIPRAVYLLILSFNIIVFWYFKDFSHQWLLGSLPYQRFGIGEAEGLAVRLIIYCISFISSISILMLIPNKFSLFSKVGKHSLFVYLWHGFFVNIAIYLGYKEVLYNLSTLTTLSILLAVSSSLTLFLSGSFISTQTQNYLIRPMKILIMSRLKH